MTAAAHLLQPVVLVPGLDAFGDHGEVEAVARAMIEEMTAVVHRLVVQPQLFGDQRGLQLTLEAITAQKGGTA